MRPAIKKTLEAVIEMALTTAAWIACLDLAAIETKVPLVHVLENVLSGLFFIAGVFGSIAAGHTLTEVQKLFQEGQG